MPHPGHTSHHQPPAPRFPTLRAAAAAAASPPVLATPLQSRPLQANPSHPLLWNGVATAAAGTGVALAAFSRPHRASSTSVGGRRSASQSSLSTPRSSHISVASPDDGRGQRRSSRDGGATSDSMSPSSTTTAHIVHPPQPAQSRVPPFAAAAAGSPAGAAGKPGRDRRVMAANYNDLLHRELHAQQPQPQPPQAHHADDVGGGTAAWPAPSPSLAPPAMAHSGASWPLSSTVGAEAGVVAALPGSMEGPLPPDVRRIIAQSCSGGAAEASAVVDATEQQARRLISTGRRVKVYREELAAAEEERRDLSAAAEQHELVRAVLQGEVVDLNGRIQALLQERALVETQLLAQDDAASRVTRQLAEAQERVSVLRHTIDGIVEETTVARLMLRQQVPSLHIENYY